MSIMGVIIWNGEPDSAQGRDLSPEAGQGSPFVPRSAAARRCETAGRNEAIPSSQSKLFMSAKNSSAEGYLTTPKCYFHLLK